jgi:hypothetical protein
MQPGVSCWGESTVKGANAVERVDDERVETGMLQPGRTTVSGLVGRPRGGRLEPDWSAREWAEETSRDRAFGARQLDGGGDLRTEDHCPGHRVRTTRAARGRRRLWTERPGSECLGRSQQGLPLCDCGDDVLKPEPMAVARCDEGVSGREASQGSSPARPMAAARHPGSSGCAPEPGRGRGLAIVCPGAQPRRVALRLVPFGAGCAGEVRRGSRGQGRRSTALALRLGSAVRPRRHGQGQCAYGETT